MFLSFSINFIVKMFYSRVQFLSFMNQSVYIQFHSSKWRNLLLFKNTCFPSKVKVKKGSCYWSMLNSFCNVSANLKLLQTYCKLCCKLTATSEFAVNFCEVTVYFPANWKVCRKPTADLLQGCGKQTFCHFKRLELQALENTFLNTATWQTLEPSPLKVGGFFFFCVCVCVCSDPLN